MPMPVKKVWLTFLQTLHTIRMLFGGRTVLQTLLRITRSSALVSAVLAVVLGLNVAQAGVSLMAKVIHRGMDAQRWSVDMNSRVKLHVRFSKFLNLEKLFVFADLRTSSSPLAVDGH
jgi:hypothetical protein